MVLVRHLPVDAACRRALDAGAGWGLTEHLLAANLDTLRGANWQRSGGKGARPKPVPRPGAGPRTEVHGRTDADPGRVADYLARFAPPPLADSSPN